MRWVFEEGYIYIGAGGVWTSGAKEFFVIYWVSYSVSTRNFKNGVLEFWSVPRVYYLLIVNLKRFVYLLLYHKVFVQYYSRERNIISPSYYTHVATNEFMLPKI